MESAVLDKSLTPRRQPQSTPSALGSGLPDPPETVLPGASPEAIEAGQREFGSRWLGPTLPVPGVPGSGMGSGIPGLLPGRWSRHGRDAVWHATLRSPGARALRLHFSSFDVDGAVYLRPAGAASGRVGPYSARGPQEDGDFWTDIVPSEAVTIEYVTRAGGRTPVGPPPFRVKDVAHLVRPLVPSSKGLRFPGQPSPVGSVPRSIAACHLDASCHPAWEDRDYPAVALVLISNASGVGTCTGSLINPRYDSDDHLLLLTAGHCVESQDDAQNAMFYWNYQTTECHGQIGRPSDLIVTTGATLVSSRDDRRADYALLRLSQRDVLAVTGVTRLGWDAGGAALGTPVVAVSHPTGAFKRISLGDITTVNWRTYSASTFTGISWRQGTTETGSSGAGIRRESDGRLIGILTAVSADWEPCDREFRSALNHFSAIYDEVWPYLDSEDSLTDARPNLSVVQLGDSGELVTIVTASDGTFWVEDRSVSDGSVLTAGNGNQYVLSRGADGVWTAQYVAPDVTVPLPAGSGQLSLKRAEDGSHWLGDQEVRDGSGLTHARYGTYKLVLNPSSREFYAEPVPAGVPLPAPGMRVETFAGSGRYDIGGDGGRAILAHFANPSDVAVSPSGNVLISDTENHRIRSVNSAGVIVTIAGTGSPGFSGDGGRATRAQLREPRGIAVGPDGEVYIADAGNHRVRVVRRDGIIETVAGSGRSGYSGDGGAAAAAWLEDPQAVAVDQHGNLYIADTGNNRIRKVTPAYITTVAGTGRFGYGGDGGPAIRAELRRPAGVAVDRAGNVYVADTGNHRIRRVGRDRTIVTVGGTGRPGFGGDFRQASQALFNYPQGLALAPDGSLHVADASNHAVRRITRFGVVHSVAGHTGGELNDLQRPSGLAFDLDGRLLVVDPAIRKVQRLEPDWTVFAPEDLPTPELVRLAEPGDWIRLWRTKDGTYYHRGWPFESGDIVSGWNGEAYRLDYHANSGWIAEPAEIDFAAEFDQDLTAAGAGDPAAQAGLGWHYATGMGVEENLAEALRWFRSAADQGNRLAQYWLGILHEEGRGVPVDASAAVEWYRLAAIQGSAPAQDRLALSFRFGLGVAEDSAAGFRWHLQAAMQDHSASQAAVARMLANGEGVPPDQHEAFRWNRLGADAGNPWSQAALGNSYLNGEGVAENLQEALRWLRLSANRGNPWAQDGLGYMYEFGQGVRTNYVRAVQWYRRAAVQGQAYSQWRLGVAFMTGRGAGRNDVAALVWLGLARSNGEDRADEAWNEVRSRLTSDQLREASERGERCRDSGYQNCP